MKNVGYCIVLLSALSACIGTDFEDSPVVGEEIKIISGETLALMPQQMATIEALYFDRYGVQMNADFQWASSNVSVATVNDGKVTAVANGQTIVQPSVGNFLGPPIQVTVVSDPDAVATVQIITPSSVNLMVGEKIQLDAEVKNISGDLLEGKTVEWFSENGSILSVSASGEVEALASGVAGIHAKVEGVKSNSIDFTVAGTVRTGTFSSAGGYKAVGTARLEIINNNLILTLSDDFDTDFALGTFIYLANSTNGATVRSSGFEVAQIFSDGGKTFNISQLNSSITLEQYRYVIVLCKPASVTFGFADLN
jgi:hypothetical protein